MSSIPVNAAAATSPSEKPAAIAGTTPRPRSASAQARSVANIAGWVFSVTASAALSPVKQSADVPGRTASHSS